MWLLNKKERPIELTAPEARVLAQLQTAKVKFDREQRILKEILATAKRGSFELRRYDDRYYHATGMYTDSAITKDDMTFLKNLGYKIEITEKIYKQYYQTTCSVDYYGRVVTGPKPVDCLYTEYYIKW